VNASVNCRTNTADCNVRMAARKRRFLNSINILSIKSIPEISHYDY
jgi:hypothetical protein